MAEGVVLGVLLPLSGMHAALGHMEKNSMLMAVDEINARGGISGGPLALDIRDSGGQARNARAVVDHFVNDKNYPVVLGGLSSSVTVALADRCEQKRIPLIVVTGSEDAITLQNYRYVFRVSPPRSKYPEAVLDFARSRLARTDIVLLTDRSAYGDAMARKVKQSARQAGWTISGEGTFESGSRNLEALYSMAEAGRPGIIFLSAFPPDGSRIIRELKRIHPEPVIINLTPASTAAGSYARCGDPCRGVLNPALWLPAAAPSASRYREKYVTRYGSEPDYHGAQAYAAVMVAYQALRKAGVPQADPVREALEGISVDTPYGRVSFKQWDGFMNQNDPPGYVVQWSGGGFEVIWPQKLRTAAPMLPAN